MSRKQGGNPWAMSPSPPPSSSQPASGSTLHAPTAPRGPASMAIKKESWRPGGPAGSAQSSWAPNPPPEPNNAVAGPSSEMRRPNVGASNGVSSETRQSGGVNAPQVRHVSGDSEGPGKAQAAPERRNFRIGAANRFNRLDAVGGRDRERDRDKEMDADRDRNRDRERDRDRIGERDRDRAPPRDRSRERVSGDRERSGNRPRDRSRERPVNKDAGKSEERSWSDWNRRMDIQRAAVGPGPGTRSGPDARRDDRRDDDRPRNFGRVEASRERDDRDYRRPPSPPNGAPYDRNIRPGPRGRRDDRSMDTPPSADRSSDRRPDIDRDRDTGRPARPEISPRNDIRDRPDAPRPLDRGDVRRGDAPRPRSPPPQPRFQRDRAPPSGPAVARNGRTGRASPDYGVGARGRSMEREADRRRARSRSRSALSPRAPEPPLSTRPASPPTRDPSSSPSRDRSPSPRPRRSPSPSRKRPLPPSRPTQPAKRPRTSTSTSRSSSPASPRRRRYSSSNSPSPPPRRTSLARRGRSRSRSLGIRGRDDERDSAALPYSRSPSPAARRPARSPERRDQSRNGLSRSRDRRIRNRSRTRSPPPPPRRLHRPSPPPRRSRSPPPPPRHRDPSPQKQRQSLPDQRAIFTGGQQMQRGRSGQSSTSRNRSPQKQPLSEPSRDRGNNGYQRDGRGPSDSAPAQPPAPGEDIGRQTWAARRAGPIDPAPIPPSDDAAAARQSWAARRDRWAEGVARGQENGQAHPHALVAPGGPRNYPPDTDPPASHPNGHLPPSTAGDPFKPAPNGSFAPISTGGINFKIDTTRSKTLAQKTAVSHLFDDSSSPAPPVSSTDPASSTPLSPPSKDRPRSPRASSDMSISPASDPAPLPPVAAPAPVTRFGHPPFPPSVPPQYPPPAQYPPYPPYPPPALPPSFYQPSAPAPPPAYVPRAQPQPPIQPHLARDQLAAHQRSYSDHLNSIAPYIQAAFKLWFEQGTIPPLPEFLVHYFGRQPSLGELDQIQQLLERKRKLTANERELELLLEQAKELDQVSPTKLPANGVAAVTVPPPSAPVVAEVIPEKPALASGEVYERLNCVGEGTYGKVYKARNAETGRLVALKRIRMEGEKDGFPVTAMREIKLLQGLTHRNVVRLLEMMVSKGSVFMVFEYMDHDLTGLLAHPEVHFSPANIKSLNYQMLDGLAYLHDQSILHRDLKGSNILLDGQGVLKLADFGLARVYSKRRRDDYTNRVITLWYRSPELLLGETVYGPEVDMWSAGCIMLELFVTKPIFQGTDEIHQLDAIYAVMGTPSEHPWPEVEDLPWYELVRPKQSLPNKFRDAFAKWLTPAALDLAEGLLSFNPAQRISARTALGVPYFIQEKPGMEMPDQLGRYGEQHEMDAKASRRKKRTTDGG